MLTEPLEMLRRPTDIRPCVNNLIVKYFKFILKSKCQPFLAHCLAIAILQNGKSGVVGKARAGGWGTVGLWTYLKVYPKCKGEVFNKELWKYLHENLDDGDSRMLW